jgi:hypothetical protein
MQHVNACCGVMTPSGLIERDRNLMSRHHTTSPRPRAWDLVRYIALCRWGHLAGVLSEAEAWDQITPAAVRLQQTFVSWQDLHGGFLIGREY